HLMYLVGFRNRYVAVMSWVGSFLGHRRPHFHYAQEPTPAPAEAQAPSSSDACTVADTPAAHTADTAGSAGTAGTADATTGTTAGGPIPRERCTGKPGDHGADERVPVHANR